LRKNQNFLPSGTSLEKFISLYPDTYVGTVDVVIDLSVMSERDSPALQSRD